MRRDRHRQPQCALAKHRSLRGAKLRGDATAIADRRYPAPADPSRSFHDFRDNKKAVCLPGRVAERLSRCAPDARLIVAEHIEKRKRTSGCINTNKVKSENFFGVLNHVIELFLIDW